MENQVRFIQDVFSLNFEAILQSLFLEGTKVALVDIMRLRTLALLPRHLDL